MYKSREAAPLAPPRADIVWSWLTRYRREEGAWSGDSPQGDRKGPHPAPHRPRPYYEVIITHIFWSISVNRGDKAFRMVAFVHKLCPVIPLHKRP